MIKEKYISVNGKELFCKIIREAAGTTGRPWLVFLHEGLGSVEQWRSLPEWIASRCSCPALVYDRYGYGKSEIKPEPNDLLYMHTEAHIFLPELLEKLEIRDKVILIGHSDGGTIALLFAARFPEQTFAVISESDHVICERITAEGIRNLVFEYEQGALKKMLAKYHGSKTDTLFYGWTGLWLSEEAPVWNILEELPLIKAPLLAIQGKDDQYGTVEQLAAKLRHAGGTVQVSFIPNCGHIPHVEKKEQVEELMTGFISSLW